MVIKTLLIFILSLQFLLEMIKLRVDNNKKTLNKLKRYLKYIIQKCKIKQKSQKDRIHHLNNNLKGKFLINFSLFQAIRYAIGQIWDYYTIQQYLIMLNQSDGSSSLIIVEGHNVIEINSSQEKSKIEDDKINKEDDLFQLSKDDFTISFRIEQQQRRSIQYMKIQKEKKIHLQKGYLQKSNLPQQKKKRKDIFNKFKKTQLIVRQPKAQDNLLNIFDSIFKCKNAQNSMTSQNNMRASKIQSNFLKIEQPQRNKTPSHEKRQRMKIFGKKHYSGQYSSILPSDILQNENPPEVKVQQKLPDSIKKQGNQILNLSSIENRYSAILNQQIDDISASKEQYQIQQILQQEIFKDNQKSPSKMKKNISQKQQIKIIATTINKSQQIQLKSPTLLTLLQKIQQQGSPSPKTKQDTIQQKQVVINSPLQLLLTQKQAIKNEEQDKNRVVHQKQGLYQFENEVLEQSKYITNNQGNNFQNETNMMRSNVSTVSMAPSMKVDTYRGGSSGYIGGNSMVNISMPFIEDMTRTTSLSNVNFANKIYQSQIIQHQTIVKINIFEQQTRIPIFLRQIRKQLSIYPNLYIQANNPNNLQTIQRQFNLLFVLFKKSIDTLNQLCQKILDVKSQKQIYNNQTLNGFTLDLFLNSGWENIVKEEDFQLIKPREKFQARIWSFQKVKIALANYNNIVQYYQNKGIKLNLSTAEGKQKYFQIRQKFMQISGNMRLISQDIYCQYLNLHFPYYYIKFLNFLKQPRNIIFSAQRQSTLKQYLNLYKHLKYQKQILVLSQIGNKIKQKIDLQLKYLRSF